MTCNTSLKEDNIYLTSSDKDKQVSDISDTSDVCEINGGDGLERKKNTADLMGQEGDVQEQNLYEAPIGQPTMIVSFQIPRREVNDAKEPGLKKSPAQKELNSVQRRKQIAEYNSLKLKEERQHRSRIRRSGKLTFVYGKSDAHSVTTSDEDDAPSSKRKKRVSFEF